MLIYFYAILLESECKSNLSYVTRPEDVINKWQCFSHYCSAVTQYYRVDLCREVVFYWLFITTAAVYAIIIVIIIISKCFSEFPIVMCVIQWNCNIKASCKELNVQEWFTGKVMCVSHCWGWEMVNIFFIYFSVGIP